MKKRVKPFGAKTIIMFLGNPRTEQLKIKTGNCSPNMDRIKMHCNTN